MESCRNDSGPVPQQIADRVQEFRRLTVAHPRLLAAKDMLVAGINEAPPGSIMMVFGPTGVGKTTLRLKVQQLLSEQSKPLMETDPSRLPFVAVEAAAPDNGTFRPLLRLKRGFCSRCSAGFQPALMCPQDGGATEYQGRSPWLVGEITIAAPWLS